MLDTVTVGNTQYKILTELATPKLLPCLFLLRGSPEVQNESSEKQPHLRPVHSSHPTSLHICFQLCIGPRAVVVTLSEYQLSNTRHHEYNYCAMNIMQLWGVGVICDGVLDNQVIENPTTAPWTDQQRTSPFIAFN